MGRELIATIEGTDISANIVEEATGIISVKLLCSLLNGTQPVEVGDKVLMKLVTDGTRTFFKDDVELEISPKGIFELTTLEWSAKAKSSDGVSWKLYTYISAKKEGTATLKVFVEGKHTNSINLTTKINQDKDVFGKKAVDKLIAENKKSLANKTACIIASDKQFGKLLNNTTFFITDSSNNKANVYTIYTRAKQIKDTGYIKSEKIFNASTFKGGGNYKPEKYSSGNENIISSYLEDIMQNRLGYHVFYFTILDGYHVLTLVVNSLNPCNKTYKIYDQLKDRDEEEFKNIDNDFLSLVSRNWDYCKFSTKFGIWKIQRK